MPGTRPVKTGSFGGHFDEVVKHFAQPASPSAPRQTHAASRALREKRDIHALLFDQAWRLDGEQEDGAA